MKSLSYLIFSFLFPLMMFGQQSDKQHDTINKQQRLYWDFFTVGVRNESYTPKDKLISQLYMEPNKSSLHWQFISFDYIIYKNFGVNFALDVYKRGYQSGIYDSFNEDVSNRYPEYFIHQVNTNLDEYEDKILSQSALKVGISYLIQINKLNIISQLSMKNFSADYNQYTAVLKEKNNNRYIKLSYEPNLNHINQWALTPSINFKYKISRITYAKIDFSYLSYKPGVVYKYSETDIFTGDVLIEQEIKCDHTIHQLYIDFGFGFNF